MKNTLQERFYMALLITMSQPRGVKMGSDDCETCAGIGYHDETLGGYADINDRKVTCPDCAGSGKYEDSITCGSMKYEKSTTTGS